MKIVASSDLGPLGSKDGPPVYYDWVLSSVTPLLLPWLGILTLLAMKSNRKGAAWLIWLPICCAAAPTLVPFSILPSKTSFFLDLIAALAVGVAAVWLLSDWLRRQHRLLTFLGVVLVLAGFSLPAFVAGQGWDLLNIQTMQTGILLAVSVVVTAIALILDGLICRSRYRPAGLYLWLFVALAAVWLVLVAPFALFVLAFSGGNIEWTQLLAPALMLAMVNFLPVLPFLILSSASPFFRERLKALLHVKMEESPPLAAPLIDPNVKTA
jgi:hypothetical protein